MLLFLFKNNIIYNYKIKKNNMANIYVDVDLSDEFDFVEGDSLIFNTIGCKLMDFSEGVFTFLLEDDLEYYSFNMIYSDDGEVEFIITFNDDGSLIDINVNFESSTFYVDDSDISFDSNISSIQ